ncbi:peptidoglycan DD-metalloendopeptidase family protein [Cellulomonas sp.]|uniref:peptidoglycan DD-metalloendopeptidase family protein n=1 Tax=Cellulomonas sp. TaxID=40001 RepID=UPI00258D419F|nr:peptidoglycan DD-metalloendopeptidase family protein [Cellulomonas sp.]
MRTRSTVWSLVLAGSLAITAMPAAVAADAPPAAPAAKVAATTLPSNVAKSRTPGGRLLMLPLVNKTYALSSGWGARCIPTRGASTFHHGLDMSAPDGAPIYAVAGGTVTHVVQPTSSVSGQIVVRTVVDGVSTQIAYLHSWNPGKYVKVGDRVKVGQRIGDVGASGPATGPHLHLEVWTGGYYQGTSHDPRVWLEGYGLPVTNRATADWTTPAPTSCTYYATANLNLRTEPATTSTVQATLPPNTTLANKPGVKTNGYIPVTVRLASGTVKGWVHADYISQSKTYHLTKATVVRQSAISTSKALLTAPAGASLTPVQVSGWWTKVVVYGVTGWVPNSVVAAGR